MPASSSRRLQGTDGIRGPFIPSQDGNFGNATPQEIFLQRGVITELFLEIYIFSALALMQERGLSAPGDSVVFAWDGRDRNGVAISAGIRAISRAGMKPILLGELDKDGRPIFGRTLPTPAAPLYMLHIGAKYAIMLTASHNPANQNGVKIFLSPWGLKPFPPDDDALSARILATSMEEVLSIPEKETSENHYRQARQMFIDYHLDTYNSWKTAQTDLSGLHLVVDTANGALSGLAGEVFERLGVGEVVEIASSQIPINERSGVADLEGHSFIPADQVLTSGGRFFSYPALAKVMEWGRKLTKEIQAGEVIVSLASFDGDGDRFFRSDYNPYEDGLVVLSGDETAVIQARFLAESGAVNPQNSLYINTVESDLGALKTARSLGYQTKLVGVGDKWILRQALSTHLKQFSISGLGLEEGMAQGMEISAELSRRELSFTQEVPNLGFAVGSEETGHNITQGRLRRLSDGRYLSTFFGNGLKSAINTYVATSRLLAGADSEQVFQFLCSPFPQGYKHNEYIFYSKKELFHRGSEVFVGLEKLWDELLRETNLSVKEERFTEEPDMLYIALEDNGEQVGALFARNSGTEPKTGLYLRGAENLSTKLEEIKERSLCYLYSGLKDWGSPLVKAQVKMLSALDRASDSGVSARDIHKLTLSYPDKSLPVHISSAELLDVSTIKEDIMALSSAGYRITPKGKIMLTLAEKLKKGERM